MLTDYEHLATERKESLFSDDMHRNRTILEDSLRNARIAVIGAAGSIGQATVELLTSYKPRSLVLIDLNENNLVEVVRQKGFVE